MMPEPTLDCQDCGRVLLRLTPEQEREVSRRPYDFVLRCAECLRLYKENVYELMAAEFGEV